MRKSSKGRDNKSECTLKTNLSTSLFTIGKFCSKKLHEIELITPLTAKDKDFVKNIVETGKKYQDLSGVYFITYEDVIELLKNLANDYQNVTFPEYMKDCMNMGFEQILKSFEKEHFIPSDILANLVKYKIIETMYVNYISEVNKMDRRHYLQAELEKLLKEPETGNKGKKSKKNKKGKKDKKKSKKDKSSKSKDKSSKGKKSKKDKSSKKSKENLKKSKSKNATQSTPKVIPDYTEIILDENDLIFDYTIENHVMYIVLSGFDEPKIFEELYKVSLSVSSIIEVSLTSSDSTKLTDFVAKLHELLETPRNTKYFENTALMKFKHSGEDSLKSILEEFLYVVKRIDYIKRQHLFYIKNLKLFDFGNLPIKLEARCLYKYNKILNGYPPEIVNIPLILDALIEQICWTESGQIYSESDVLTESSESLPKSRIYKKNPYQVHEDDQLNMILNSFKEIGRKCYDKTLEYLKLLKPLEPIEATHDMKEKQDRIISTEECCYCSNIKEYYDYFHLALFCQMKRRPCKINTIPEYDFIRNIVPYDASQSYQKVLPQITGQCVSVDPIKQNNIILNYHLKEDLSTSVLRQLIFKALLEFSTWDRLYCNITDAILLRFHDNLNEFGIETKFWNQSLRTPVCLRDFCKFITIENKKWLEENALEEHSILNQKVDEECQGLKDLNIPEVYKEYQFLLGTSTEKPDERKIIFDKILGELMNYPRSDYLASFCAKSNDETSFLGYDLGPNRIQLTGHTTIFNSDDGVKVTIDNSRFLTENPKCSIKIVADDNTFVFHSTNLSDFHFILSDETVIKFSEIREIRDSVTSSKANDKKTEESENINEEEIEPEEYPEDRVQQIKKSKLGELFPLPGKFDISERKIDIDGDNMNDLLEKFKTALQMGHPIYKISMKPSTCHLKRKTSPLTFPLFGVIQRILFKPLRKKKKIRGYSVVINTKGKNEAPSVYDFCITLPNGLTIIPLARTSDILEIKQTYKFCKTDEQYRIFYKTGMVLVKHFDGTTTIYRSNGDIIKLTDESENYSEICPVNCPKNMTGIFGKSEEDVCPFEQSRCDPPIILRQTKIVSLYEFGDIPYNKKTIIDFDGKKLTDYDGKITEKQVYYVVNENDYHTEERYFERDDGMRCVIDKKGKRTIQFPDGTKITAWYEIEKDLIFIDKKSEGWLSVTINYKFEHPNYIAIIYDEIGKNTEIFLKDGVIKSSKDSFFMCLKSHIGIEVNRENIIFVKTCPICDGDCICKIYLKNEKNENFLEIFDSYNKYLKCDYNGNCKINAFYIKRDLNQNNCDHRSKHEIQKMFILNSPPQPPGSVLWHDGLIRDKIDESRCNNNVKFLNYISKFSKKQTLEFLSDVYQNFEGRFTMSQLYNKNLILSRLKNLRDKSNVFYVTFRILTEFQSIKSYGEAFEELNQFFETNLGRMSPFLTEGLKIVFDFIASFDNLKKVASTFSLFDLQIQQIDESTSSSSKDSSDLDDKKHVGEIIAAWKKTCEEYRHLIKYNIFQPYFHSDYYQYVSS